MAEAYRMPDGTLIVNVHDVGRCVGRHCVIHNPSAHHMRSWPIVWRQDMGVFERKCLHGRWHPDPDSTAFLRSVGQSGAHGCDGCCRDATIDGEVVVSELTGLPPRELEGGQDA